MSQNTKNKKVFLMILDGWGIGDQSKSDAVYHAKTPHMDALMQKYPHSTLRTDGNFVGLPEGQMGNSEVGHMNIGAGRVVYQELQKINNAIENGELGANETLNNTFKYALENKKPLHLLGILSDGGVHGHINHLKALVTYALDYGLTEVYIHAFTDGRDTDPHGGKEYLQDLLQFLEGKSAQLASVTGRYYAMDRDKRWDRVAIAYHAMVNGEGELTNDFIQSVQAAYDNDITDEFLKPMVAQGADGKALLSIQSGDAVLAYNFRTDRCREITEVLTQRAELEHGMQPLTLHYVTMTEYDASYENVQVIFYNHDIVNTLGEVLEKAGKSQVRIAETEKYPHVTFFFSGGRETPFEQENRILIPSPKEVATYDLKPEMGAYEITDAIIKDIQDNSPDFICLNFANADMVGHTGVWEAAVKACEVVDECVGKILPEALAKDYALFIIADHGNSDYMINDDGTPNTAHSLNKVPFVFVSEEDRPALKDGKLGDLAPTILTYMGVNIPEEMTGEVLFD